jgi:hypothetical protein
LFFAEDIDISNQDTAFDNLAFQFTDLPADFEFFDMESISYIDEHLNVHFLMYFIDIRYGIVTISSHVQVNVFFSINLKSSVIKLFEL